MQQRVEGAEEADGVSKLSYLSATMELLLNRKSVKEQGTQLRKYLDLKCGNKSLLLVLHFQNKLSGGEKMFIAMKLHYLTKPLISMFPL